MNKLLNAIGRVALTLLIMLLIGYGWAFLEMKILLRSNPELFGLVFYQQTDSAMVTSFSEDDIVIVQKNADYTVGDKVMYMTEENDYYVRNVTGINSNAITISCDNCKLDHEEIATNMVVGKAIGKIRNFGKFIKFFKQKWFLITLAIVGFGFVIISQYIHETPKKLD